MSRRQLICGSRGGGIRWRHRREWWRCLVLVGTDRINLHVVPVAAGGEQQQRRQQERKNAFAVYFIAHVHFFFCTIKTHFHDFFHDKLERNSRETFPCSNIRYRGRDIALQCPLSANPAAFRYCEKLAD